jgi:hypothetical protein
MATRCLVTIKHTLYTPHVVLCMYACTRTLIFDHSMSLPLPPGGNLTPSGDICLQILAIEAMINYKEDYKQRTTKGKKVHVLKVKEPESYEAAMSCVRLEVLPETRPEYRVLVPTSIRHTR